jgi:antibiotic biosynthesis monooxygenase (ABM) superfamily enzyme
MPDAYTTMVDTLHNTYATYADLAAYGLTSRLVITDWADHTVIVSSDGVDFITFDDMSTYMAWVDSLDRVEVPSDAQAIIRDTPAEVTAS